MADSIPLSPTTGGICITSAALAVGDIIVSTTNKISSSLVRAATAGDVSHAAVYIDTKTNMVIEAVPDEDGKPGGVIKKGLDASLKLSNLAVAYRYPGLTDAQKSKVVSFLTNARGSSYNYDGTICAISPITIGSLNIVGLLTLDMPRVTTAIIYTDAMYLSGCHTPGSGRTKFFCSQLVILAYEAAGIRLTPKSSYRISPQDFVNIYDGGKLTYVGHLIG